MTRNLEEKGRIFLCEAQQDVGYRSGCRGARANPNSGLKENDKSESNGSADWDGFLRAWEVGALVGVLYAPKAGTETRADLMQGASDAKQKAADLAQQGLDKAGDYVDQGKQVAGDYVDKGKEYYEKGRSQWTQYVEKGKDLVASQQDAVQSAIDAGKQVYASKAQDQPTT